MHFPCFGLLISVWLVSLWEDKAVLNWYLYVAFQYCAGDGLVSPQQPGCVQQWSQFVLTEPGVAVNQPHLTQGQRSMIYWTGVWWGLYITPLKEVAQSEVLSVGFLSSTCWSRGSWSSSMLGHLYHPWLTCSSSHAGRDWDSAKYGQVMSYPPHSNLHPQLGALRSLLLCAVSLVNSGPGEPNPWAFLPILYAHQKGEKNRTRAGSESVYCLEGWGNRDILNG